MWYRVLIITLIFLVIFRKRVFSAIGMMPLNPILKRMKIRVDSMGDGHFGSSRGNRLHNGVDFVCTPGESVFSPIEGKVVRISNAYSDDPNYLNIVLQNSEFLVKLMYVKPKVIAGVTVKKGDVIGVAQAINKKYGSSMINHIHFEVWKDGAAVNPENFIKV